jgi:hypothetical protein
LYDAARHTAEERDEMDQNQAPRNDELPIVCTLTGEERSERGGVAHDLFAQAEQVRELPDGYAFRFPGTEDWAARLLDYVAFERRCCRFFTFALEFEPDQGPIWLYLRGPEGVKELIGSSDAAIPRATSPA